MITDLSKDIHDPRRYARQRGVQWEVIDDVRDPAAIHPGGKTRYALDWAYPEDMLPPTPEGCDHVWMDPQNPRWLCEGEGGTP